MHRPQTEVGEHRPPLHLGSDVWRQGNAQRLEPAPRRPCQPFLGDQRQDRVGLLQQRNVDSDSINQRLDELAASAGTTELSERLALLGQRLAATEEATRVAAEQESRLAEQLAALKLVCHGLISDPAVSDLLDRAEQDQATLDDWQRANLREMRRQWRASNALPESLVTRQQLANSRCEHAWRTQRPANDWAGFLANFRDVLWAHDRSGGWTFGRQLANSLTVASAVALTELRPRFSVSFLADEYAASQSQPATKPLMPPVKRLDSLVMVAWRGDEFFELDPRNTELLAEVRDVDFELFRVIKRFSQLQQCIITRHLARDDQA